MRLGCLFTLRGAGAMTPGVLGMLAGAALLFNCELARGRPAATEPRDTELRLVLVSWVRLLDRLDALAIDEGVKSDIQQLRGLASEQNEQVFLPTHSEPRAAPPSHVPTTVPLDWAGPRSAARASSRGPRIRLLRRMARSVECLRHHLAVAALPYLPSRQSTAGHQESLAPPHPDNRIL